MALFFFFNIHTRVADILHMNKHVFVSYIFYVKIRIGHLLPITMMTLIWKQVKNTWVVCDKKKAATGESCLW